MANRVFLGEWIEAERCARGYSQEALAGSLGITQSYLSRIERGKAVPSFTVAYWIARFFGVELCLKPERGRCVRLHPGGFIMRTVREPVEAADE